MTGGESVSWRGGRPDHVRNRGGRRGLRVTLVVTRGGGVDHLGPLLGEEEAPNDGLGGTIWPAVWGGAVG